MIPLEDVFIMHLFSGIVGILFSSDPKRFAAFSGYIGIIAQLSSKSKGSSDIVWEFTSDYLYRRLQCPAIIGSGHLEHMLAQRLRGLRSVRQRNYFFRPRVRQTGYYYKGGHRNI